MLCTNNESLCIYFHPFYKLPPIQLEHNLLPWRLILNLSTPYDSIGRCPWFCYVRYWEEAISFPGNVFLLSWGWISYWENSLLCKPSPCALSHTYELAYLSGFHHEDEVIPMNLVETCACVTFLIYLLIFINQCGINFF